jgi:hypothetical protein
VRAGVEASITEGGGHPLWSSATLDKSAVQAIELASAQRFISPTAAAMAACACARVCGRRCVATGMPILRNQQQPVCGHRCASACAPVCGQGNGWAPSAHASGTNLLSSRPSPNLFPSPAARRRGTLHHPRWRVTEHHVRGLDTPTWILQLDTATYMQLHVLHGTAAVP